MGFTQNNPGIELSAYIAEWRQDHYMVLGRGSRSDGLTLARGARSHRAAPSIGREFRKTSVTQILAGEAMRVLLESE